MDCLHRGGWRQVPFRDISREGVWTSGPLDLWTSGPSSRQRPNRGALGGWVTRSRGHDPKVTPESPITVRIGNKNGQKWRPDGAGAYASRRGSLWHSTGTLSEGDTYVTTVERTHSGG
eukprot:2224130-Pyramimonas_sp.AAC.1